MGRQKNCGLTDDKLDGQSRNLTYDLVHAVFRVQRYRALTGSTAGLKLGVTVLSQLPKLHRLSTRTVMYDLVFHWRLRDDRQRDYSVC